MPQREILSSRERIRLALEHRETDRIPIAMVCAGINPPAYRELENYLQRERGVSVNEYLHPLIDIKGIAPEYVGPRLNNGEDMWGVRRKPVSYGPGSYNEIYFYPLKGANSVDDLKRHRWPSTSWFDYSVIPERIAAAQVNGEYCLMIANGNIFETSWYMRGFERMLLDFALNPELAHGIMARAADFYIEHFQKILSAAKGDVDLAFTADDIGSQKGLLMSLEMWEEFIKPYHIRLNKVIHEFGVKVIYHTDGAVMDAVDGLIDMGIDVLQALQFSADGMDAVELKQKYGDRLCFEGGVSVQTTLPFGNPKDVQREVKELITVLGKNGGYILGPSHAIQAGTPPENIVAMFDTASSFYPF
ncbi:MAG: uroporphyrinogen decarboxylase family protein [Candidatus Poribacteria bacterium]